MPKLYRSALHGQYWITFTSDTGWVSFPAKENGWEERQQCRGVDPLHLREVPLRNAAHTGFIEWLRSEALTNVA